jgi:hypothetical protein
LAKKVSLVAAGLAALLSGAVAGSELQQISQSGFGAFEVSLAPSGEHIAAAWFDTRNGSADIYLRLLDSSGKPASPEYRLTTTKQQSYEVSIDTLDGGLGIAWYEKSATGSQQAQIGRWKMGNGLEWQTPVSLSSIDSRIPVLRTFGSRIFCAWIETSGTGAESVMANWWDEYGEPQGDPIRVGPAGSTTWNLNAAIDEQGIAYVVFDAISKTRAEEVFLARIDDRAVSLVRLTEDDGYASKYPDLVLSPTGLALTWFDERDGNREVYFFASSTRHLKYTIDHSSRRVTRSPGASIGAYLAINCHQISLVWSDNSDGIYDVYLQKFDLQGESIGQSQRIALTPSQSLIPAIQSWGSGFIVAWNEIQRSTSGYHSDETRAEIFVQLLR